MKTKKKMFKPDELEPIDDESIIVIIKNGASYLGEFCTHSKLFFNASTAFPFSRVDVWAYAPRLDLENKDEE